VCSYAFLTLFLIFCLSPFPPSLLTHLPSPSLFSLLSSLLSRVRSLYSSLAVNHVIIRKQGIDRYRRNKIYILVCWNIRLSEWTRRWGSCVLSFSLSLFLFPSLYPSLGHVHIPLLVLSTPCTFHSLYREPPEEGG